MIILTILLLLILYAILGVGGDISVVVTRCLRYFHGRLVQPTAGHVSINLLMIGMCQVVPLGCPMISVCAIYPLLHE